MPRILFANEAEREAYKAEKREYAKRYRAQLKANGLKPYRSSESIERDKLRVQTEEAKIKRAKKDKIRQSTAEFKARKNELRRARYLEKCAAIGKRPQPRCYETKEQRKEAKTRWWQNWKKKNP